MLNPPSSFRGLRLNEKIPFLGGAVGVVSNFKQNEERRSDGIKGGYASFTNHPVCAAKDASRHLFDGAATPPLKGGEWGWFRDGPIPLRY